MQATIGFIFGIVLVAAAGVAAGFGHGVYFPLGFIAAPFSIIGVKAAFLVVPLLWALIGHGVRAQDRSWRFGAIALIVIQYLTGAFLLTGQRQFADYEYWPRVPAYIQVWAMFAIGLYLLGQLVFWWELFHSKQI